MNTFTNSYDAVQEAESRVAFINHAVCCIIECNDNDPMPTSGWQGLFYITQDLMDIMKEAQKLYKS